MDPIINSNIQYTKSFSNDALVLTSNTIIGGKTYKITLQLTKDENLTPQEEQAMIEKSFSTIKMLQQKEGKLTLNRQIALNHNDKDGVICKIEKIKTGEKHSSSNPKVLSSQVRFRVQKIEREKFNLENLQNTNNKVIDQIKISLEKEESNLEELQSDSDPEMLLFIAETQKQIDNYQNSIKQLKEENEIIQKNIFLLSDEARVLAAKLGENPIIGTNFIKLLQNFISDQKSHTLSLTTNSAIRVEDFPTNYIAQKVDERTYNLTLKYTCHLTALSVTEFLKIQGVIENKPYSQLRENNLEEAKNLLSTPFSFHRVLTNYQGGKGTHEFVIANLGETIFLVQSDQFKGKKITHPSGIIEMLEDHIEKILSNDPETFEDFFDLNPLNKASLKIIALDSYQINKDML